MQTVILLFVLAATLLAWARALPWQNVLMAGLTIALISFGAYAVAGDEFHLVGLGNPEQSSGRLADVSWRLPVLWVVILLNSRLLARRLVGKCGLDRHSARGFWVIGLTAVLALGLNLALEPLADKSGLSRFPVTSLLHRAVVEGALALVSSVLMTPWLLDKRRAVFPPA